VEAHAGWERVQIKDSADGYSETGHKDGFTYGGGVGYDFRKGDVVFGVEAAIDGSTTKDCLSDGTESACLNAGRDIEAGARVGQVFANRALVYVKVAYANARVNLKYRDSAVPADNFSDHSDRGGIRVGGGVEYAITPRAYVKAEYRYTDYKDYRAYGERVGLSRHQVLGGVGFRF